MQLGGWQTRIGMWAVIAGPWLSGVAVADSGDCNMPRVHFNAGADTIATMQVRHGTACLFHMEFPSSAVGVAGIISTNTTERPKHGLLGKHNVRLFAYKPKDDYVGADHFEIRIRYDKDKGDGEMESLMKVDVTVY